MKAHGGKRPNLGGGGSVKIAPITTIHKHPCGHAIKIFIKARMTTFRDFPMKKSYKTKFTLKKAIMVFYIYLQHFRLRYITWTLA